MANETAGPSEEKGLSTGRSPRVCMVTARSVARHAFRCALYDGEDVFSAIDDVDLIHLRPCKRSELKHAIQRRLVWHDPSGRLVLVNVAFEPVRLTEDYDLFIVYLPFAAEAIRLSAVRDWTRRCRTSICWIDELWAAEVPGLKPFLSALDRFEHVIIGCHGAVRALSDSLGRQCQFVPTAVDALRFSPYPDPPIRVVDVYSMGRRREEQHRAILRAAAKNKLFYLYDTLAASDAEVHDAREHREMLAGIVKRSRFFVVAPGKIDLPGETGGQVEVGLRYYEGAAAGTVMIGQAPDCEPFRTMFDWPDVVVTLKPDGSDVADVLSQLTAHPERVVEVGRRNAREALLRHDWVYRWEAILKIAGLSPRPQLLERKRRLEELADTARWT